MSCKILDYYYDNFKETYVFYILCKFKTRREFEILGQKLLYINSLVDAKILVYVDLGESDSEYGIEYLEKFSRRYTKIIILE